MLLLSICWILILLALLFRAIPAPGFPRELEQRVLYHALWLLMVCLLVGIHYKLMSAAGHAMLAVNLDESAVVLYIGYYLFCRALDQIQASRTIDHTRSFIAREMNDPIPCDHAACVKGLNKVEPGDTYDD